MTENPYDPPPEDDAPVVQRETKGKIRMPGRWLTVTALGIATGLAVAFAFNYYLALNPIVVIGLAMFVACSLGVLMLRGLEAEVSVKIGLTLLLTVASFVLFVPVCTAGGFAAASVGMQEMYGPDAVGLTMASLFGAVLALNLVFAFAIGWLNRRM